MSERNQTQVGAHLYDFVSAKRKDSQDQSLVLNFRRAVTSGKVRAGKDGGRDEKGSGCSHFSISCFGLYRHKRVPFEIFNQTVHLSCVHFLYTRH